jgi:hypothetical protein
VESLAAVLLFLSEDRGYIVVAALYRYRVCGGGFSIRLDAFALIRLA